MKRCIIFVGGDIRDYSIVSSRLRNEDILIAADSGARHVAALGRIPQLLIGDMDSIDPVIYRHFQESGSSCEIHRPEKDETDGELAIQAALDMGADQVLIFGILGDRLDHFLGVLSLLKRLLDGGVRGRMVSDTQEIWLIQGEEMLDMPPGSLVSFLPFGDQAAGVTLKGFKYPLEHYDYLQGKPIGLSNIIEKTPATVTIGRGILVAVHTFQEVKKD